jgi:hypothetical protein
MADALPNFLKLDGKSLLFDLDEGEFVFYVPEVFVDSEKIAVQLGNQIRMFGICNYGIMNKAGNVNHIYPFTYPTVFLTEPYAIDKVKGMRIKHLLKEAYEEQDNDDDYDELDDQNADPDVESTNEDAADYRLLRYKKGDKIVVSIDTPKNIENVEYFFILFLLTAKFPTTIPYDTLHEYFIMNGELNDFGYGLNMQNFGITVSEIARDAKDISRPFRYSKMTDMHAYQPMSIKLSPKYVSPYSSIISENIDQGIMGAVLTNGSQPPTPLEKVLMM